MFRSPLLAWFVTAGVTQLALFATTIYLHRVLSHRAITLSPGVAGVLRVILWLTTGIRPRQWVAVHRLHHAHADEEGDPHSPLIEGFNQVQFGNYWMYKRAANNPAVVARYARDLPGDRWDRTLFDHAFLGLGLGIVFLCLLLGPWLGLVSAGVHAVAYVLLSAAVNAVGHRFGRQPHPGNMARNSQWLAWLTAGEGLHNNHHAAPTSARFAMRRGEIDPGWWVVAFLQRLRWARVRHERPVMARPAAA
ncbi:MAG TPA: fatty acid desaturase [Acidimicrobiales bacterium]|nr:fatty acid desaturase [Acidimicrobiales bacterium]